MGLFDPEIESTEPKWQRRARQELTTLSADPAKERLARAGQSYSGELVAPMSTNEQTGQNLLTTYLAAPSYTSGGLYTSAQDELAKTLGGETYDPAGGEYYQAFRTAVLRELQDSKDRLGSQLSASDAYFGGGRVKETSNLEEGAMTQLAQTLGQLALQERQNRLNAVPLAANLAQQGEGAELAKIAAAQQYGSLPREIQQAENTAGYQEWMRQLSDLGIPLDVYASLLTYQPPMTVGQSPFSQIAGLAGAITGAAGQAGGFGKLF